jgi:hypothetical protein
MHHRKYQEDTNKKVNLKSEDYFQSQRSVNYEKNLVNLLMTIQTTYVRMHITTVFQAHCGNQTADDDP